jgi:hypothetical protein
MLAFPLTNLHKSSYKIWCYLVGIKSPTIPNFVPLEFYSSHSWNKNHDRLHLQLTSIPTHPLNYHSSILTFTIYSLRHHEKLPSQLKRISRTIISASQSTQIRLHTQNKSTCIYQQTNTPIKKLNNNYLYIYVLSEKYCHLPMFHYTANV